MVRYTEYVEHMISEQPENKIWESSQFYNGFTQKIPEMTYYKILTRLVQQGKLVHVTKGVYYRPKKSRFGVVPISSREIVQHYIKHNTGLVIGYQMYHQKGITTQIAKSTEILSTTLTEEKKHVRTVSVRKLSVNLNAKVISVIETLEILQNYSKIEDLNRKAFITYMERFAQTYSNQVVDYVMAHRKYKKSTIAFLEQFLNYLHVENDLKKYLSPLSKYAIPAMEDIYELT